MASSVTLADILEGYSVSEEQLKIPCTQELFLKVAEKLTSWEPLANSLGLSEEEVRDIKESYTSNYTLASLTKWEHKVGVAATFLELAKALEKMWHLSLIEELVKSSPASLERQVAVDQNVQRFEKRFEDLAKDTLRELTKGDVDFTTSLVPSTIRDDHLTHMTNIEKLKDESDLKGIFQHFNVYWDFFHYTLLEMIIEKYGSTDLKEKMKTYVSDLIIFLQETRMTEYIPEFKIRHPFMKKYQKLALVLNESFFKYTLLKLKELKHYICGTLNLPEHIMILHSVRPGSVGVTWYILEDSLSLDAPSKKMLNIVGTLKSTMNTLILTTTRSVNTLVSTLAVSIPLDTYNNSITPINSLEVTKKLA